MANNWSTFQLSGGVTTDVISIANTLSGLISSLNRALSVTQAALEVTSNLASEASTDSVELLISQAIGEIEDLISGLLTESTAHAILIPIQKQHYGHGVLIPAESINERELIATFDDLLDTGSFYRINPDTIPSETITFINTASRATGGNAGFWRALWLSTLDEGDLGRPTFPQEFAVAGSCILFGAATLAELQTSFLTFMRLFNLGSRMDPTARTLPVVENVKVVEIPNTTETGGIGIRITWDAMPPVLNFPLFSEEQIRVEEILVIRSTNPSMREAVVWQDLFSTQPTDDINDLPKEFEHAVIARLRNDGIVRGYIDENPGVEKSTPVYYCVALRYSINGHVMPVTALSNTQRIVYAQRPSSSRKSELPDWWATPSVVSLLPPLAGILAQLEKTLEPLRSRAISGSGPAAMIRQTIAQIEALIERGDNIAEDLQRASQALNSLATLNAAATAKTLATTFSVGNGGMEAWMSELARKLSDPEDTSRPTFENGDLVAGLVIVAGAPNPSNLVAFTELLSLLFGAGENDPFLDAIESIDASIPTPTVITLDNGLAATRASNATPAESRDISFDSNMNPVAKPVDC